LRRGRLLQEMRRVVDEQGLPDASEGAKKIMGKLLGKCVDGGVQGGHAGALDRRLRAIQGASDGLWRHVDNAKCRALTPKCPASVPTRPANLQDGLPNLP
jgi:hypothetical protein